MAIYSKEHRLLFLGNPRSASTAIGDHLRASLGAQLLPPSDIMGIHGRPALRAKHCNLPDLMRSGIIPFASRGALRTFAVLRNPLDIVLTWYHVHRDNGRAELNNPSSTVWRIPGRADHMRLALELDFPGWVDQVVGSGAYSGEGFMRCVYDVDEVLRYEALKEDFGRLMRRWGVPIGSSIPRANVTAGKAQAKATQACYTDGARATVLRVFREHWERWRDVD